MASPLGYHPAPSLQNSRKGFLLQGEGLHAMNRFSSEKQVMEERSMPAIIFKKSVWEQGSWMVFPAYARLALSFQTSLSHLKNILQKFPDILSSVFSPKWLRSLAVK